MCVKRQKQAAHTRGARTAADTQPQVQEVTTSLLDAPALQRPSTQTSPRFEITGRYAILKTYGNFLCAFQICFIIFGKKKINKRNIFGIKLLERGQEAPAMIQGLEPLCWEDRLGELRLFSLGKRRLWGDLGAAASAWRGCERAGEGL